MKFQILKTPKELPWEDLLQVLDVIGLWHYSRTVPNKEDYEFRDYGSRNGFYVRCLTTQTEFHFNNDWRTSFSYIKDDKSCNANIEGKIYSAIPLVEVLLQLSAVTLDQIIELKMENSMLEDASDYWKQQTEIYEPQGNSPATDGTGLPGLDQRKVQGDSEVQQGNDGQGSGISIKSGPSHGYRGIYNDPDTNNWRL